MSNIHSILPLLSDDSWSWDKEEVVDEQLQAGRSKDIFANPNIPGFLYYGLVTVRGSGGEKCEVDIGVDTFNYRSTIEEAYALGAVEASAVTPAIARYDSDNDVYTLLYQPSPPLAYVDSLNISVDAPSEQSVRLDSIALKLDILDIDSFRRSYQMATSGELLQGIEDLRDEFVRTNNSIQRMIEEIQDVGGFR